MALIDLIFWPRTNGTSRIENCVIVGHLVSQGVVVTALITSDNVQTTCKTGPRVLGCICDSGLSERANYRDQFNEYTCGELWLNVSIDKDSSVPHLLYEL